MKTLLVTSEITFVPGNYDDLVCGLASCPEIGGLLVLTNRDRALYGKAIGVFALGARRIGWHLLRNLRGPSLARRRTAYKAHKKPVWTLPTINSEAARTIVRGGPFDLVLNARTRFIYRKRMLAAPRLGCINIHHGLLPQQRGTMCDLWALHERGSAGFTVHSMTPKIDDGAVVRVVEVSGGSDRDYARYLQRAARREAEVLPEVLREIAERDAVQTVANVAAPDLVHRKNPTWREIRAIRRAGLAI